MDLRTAGMPSRRSWCYFQLSLIKFVSESSAGRTIPSGFQFSGIPHSPFPFPNTPPSALSGATIYIIQVI